MTRTQQNTASITRHRLFGPGLALWFGALFGLSSLAVRNGLFEALVVASRIDQVVPAAAPPLGHAARLLLALGFALVGGMIGWAVARAITGAPAAERAARDPDPDRGHADLFDPHPAPAEPAPLADDRYQVRARDAHPDAPARRPILAREELRHADFAAPIEPVAEAAPPPAAPPAVPEAPAPATAPAEVAAVAPVSPAPPPAAGWDDDGPVMGPARDGAAAPAEQAPILAPAHPEPTPIITPVAPVAAAPYLRPEPAVPTAAQRIAASAPTELSHVELIERLALAMQRREADGLALQPPVDSHPSGAEALRAALDSLKGTSHG